jgi:hypothetical protein
LKGQWGIRVFCSEGDVECLRDVAHFASPMLMYARRLVQNTLITKNDVFNSSVIGDINRYDRQRILIIHTNLIARSSAWRFVSTGLTVNCLWLRL